MKTVLTIILSLILVSKTSAQTGWFSCYDDSLALVNSANKIILEVSDKVNKSNTAIQLDKNKAVKNTKPYLIFIKNKMVNLPFWAEVIPQQKDFFKEVAGGEKEGKEVFGLFFNGFYLAHELGHSFSADVGKKFENNYDSEYDANIFAILYWKAASQSENLRKCYDYTKKMLKNLKNPVPENEDYKKYITENYDKLASDPYKYGYIQFSQFVEIYENNDLPDFDSYIKTYNK